MSLRLEVPIRVEVVGAPNADDLARIERATGDATLAALDRLRRELVAPRGPNRTVQVALPDITVEGSLAESFGNHDVLRRAVGAGINYATSASGIVQTGGQISPDRFGGEPVDRSRLLNGHYRIPFFDDGSPGDVPADGEVVPPPFDLDAALIRLWQGHLRRFGPTWDPTRFGYPGYYGSFTFEGEVQHNELVYLDNVGALDEEGWPIEYAWRRARVYMFSYFEGSDSIGTTAVDATADHWVLTRTEERATAARLLELAQSIPVPGGGEPPDPEVQARMAARAADPNGFIYTLVDSAGGNQAYLSIVPGNDQGGIAHSPIRFVADQHQIGSGEGGSGVAGESGGASGRGGDGTGNAHRGSGSGAGTSRKRSGGPMGTAVGEGKLWPTTGLGGEPLVCQPFLGEPAATQLHRGGELLMLHMQRLAARLEVEPCGYAGQFAVNAAKLIGGRAHAIGVVSANSSVTTRVQVRPNGDGNTGYSEITPGDAPELQYLQLLGDLVGEVIAFANLVTEVYLLPDNRELIFTTADHDYDPNPAGWALRMWGEFTINESCMWLFAETCRVILLQQLRSSRTGIEGRRGRFESTLQMFNQKLDILGASVVKMTTLRRALRHANRYGLTGSVRSVLSHEPPPRHYGHGEMIEVPAPIVSVAANIVDLLEGATVSQTGAGRVANFGGRAWTEAELDQAVALRRGMLNMTDPMFVQIGDLDSIYTSYQRDPESSRRFLDNLLTEMHEANAGMIDKASSPAKGAFFALEASQYVKAQGGHNDRGLRFDLQGIHDLADHQLAPHCGHLYAYITGVNMAIGIKAGWDDFLAIFSTVGIIGLALLCAPLGAVAAGVITGVAGIALTIHDELEAERMEDLYRALEDPEAILHWQDVELQRLMANLSWAFSIFDVIGVAKGAKAIVAGARTSLREAAEVGVRGAARDALRASREAVLRNMAGEVMENAIKEAMQATVMVAAMTALLPSVVTPVLVPWIQRTAAEHGTLPEVQAVLAQLEPGGSHP